MPFTPQIGGQHIGHSWSDLRRIALSRPFNHGLTRDNFIERVGIPGRAVWCDRCNMRATAAFGLIHYPDCDALDEYVRFRLADQSQVQAKAGRILARFKRKPKR